MATSTVLKNIAKEKVKQPILILEIDGIDAIFSSLPVESLWRLDEGLLFDTMGLRWDTPYPNDKAIDCISPDRTTKNLTQQILPDKEGTSSIATLKIELVDKDLQVTNKLAFGNQVQDILGRKASVFFSYKGASHPEDSLPILYGYIDDYEVIHGSFLISVSHPENLKRKQVFDEYTSVLTADIDDLVTIIPVEVTASLELPVDVFESYIRINDEVMRVISKTDTTIEVERAQFGTIADEHSEEDDVSFIYRFGGQPLDLALKIMLSSSANEFNGEQDITSIRVISATENISNAIFFEGFDVKDRYGLVIGDIIEVYDSDFNDGIYTITGFDQNIIGTWITVNQDLVNEVDTNFKCRFKSKYAVLPFGLGLTGREVDVQGHEDIATFNPQNFPDYDFFLDEQIDGKEFIDKEIYFPVALFSVPRKARISCKLVRPPLAQNQIVRCDETTISNIEDIRIKRSTHKFLYNTIFYKYNLDIVDDKYLAGRIYRNELSAARIPIGTKQLTIISDGLRDTLDTRNLLNRQQQRLFDRYKFAAQEVFDVEVFTEIGFDIEIGDIVVFGSNNVQLTDLSTGERIFKARLMEVINKSFNVFTGQVKLNLLESAYELDARYGIVSPSSFIGAGSTQTELVLKQSFFVGDFVRDTDKWIDFDNERILVRNEDYSIQEITTIRGISPTDPNVLLVDALSFVPSEDFIIEIPEYTIGDDDIYKDLFVFANPSTIVTNILSTNSFEVDDASPLFVGAPVYFIRDNGAYDTFSIEDLVIDSINLNEITLNKDFPIGLQAGDRLELVGFNEQGGSPYRIV